MKSLRTIDNTKRGILLVNKESKIDTKCKIDDNIKQVVHVENILSKSECEEICNLAKVNFGFQSLSEQYLPTQRQAERLCVIDGNLSELLWNRLSPILSDAFPNVEPFGFFIQDEKSKWTPSSINPCMRLSKYEAPSCGFKPHYDSQYCKSPHTRSALSIVIYLNMSDDCIGGETAIYINNSKRTLGLTVEEEIKVNKLDNYKIYKFRPTIGSCLIFPHELLHTGEPLLKGSKIILRTDVIFNNNNITFPLGSKLFGLAMDFFREAQNLELAGDITKASELYERALSLRIGSKCNIPAAKNSGVYSLYEDGWVHSFGFSSYDDLTAIRSTCQLFKALVNRTDAIRWCQIRKSSGIIKSGGTIKSTEIIKSGGIIKSSGIIKSGGLIKSSEIIKPVVKNSEINKVTDSKTKLLWLPKLIKKKATYCKFSYQKKYFNKYKDNCLRALAMAAFCEFGNGDKNDTMIIHYDPERKRSFECSKEWLIKCAFFELPCTGEWYHCYKNDNFDLRSESFNPKVVTSNSSIKDKKVIVDTPSSTRDAFSRSVDAKFLTNKSSTSNLDNVDLYAFLTERKDKSKYQTATNNIDNSRKTGYAKFSHVKGTKMIDPCTCFGPRAYEDKKSVDLLYNNIICDFSKTRLDVKSATGHDEKCPVMNNFHVKTSLDHWVAKLDCLNSAFPSFNHASCQCGAEEYSVGDFERTEFECYNIVDHLHIFSSPYDDDDDTCEFITQYHAVQAL